MLAPWLAHERYSNLDPVDKWSFRICITVIFGTLAALILPYAIEDSVKTPDTDPVVEAWMSAMEAAVQGPTQPPCRDVTAAEVAERLRALSPGQRERLISHLRVLLTTDPPQPPTP